MKAINTSVPTAEKQGRFTPRFKRRLKRTIIIFAVLFVLLIRLFAVFILSEPFFGETITSWFDGEQKKEITDPAFFADAKRYGYPVQTNNSTDFSDLQFLDTIVSQKQIVGMGEATHGSKDFFEMKARMFQYLVQQHGFKIFAIEADFTACQQINDYVLNGIGNAKEVLSHNGYYVWQSQEVVNLIEWMHSYNRSRPDSAKVQFWGYDMQQASAPYQYLSAYLRQTNIPVDANLLMPSFDKDVKSKKVALTDSARASWYTKLKTLQGIFATNKDSMVSRSSEAQYALCLQIMKNIGLHFDRLNMARFNQSYAYRDSCMMENITWIMAANHNAKTMLWAHNGHIANDEWDGTKTDPPAKWMGRFLKGRYGAAYYSVGFLFDEGSFTAHKPPSGGTMGLFFSFAKSLFRSEPWKVDSLYVSSYRKNHLSRALAKDYTGPLFFHNAAIPSSSALYKAFNSLQSSYYIGAGFFTQASAVVEQNYASTFDAVIFINNIRAAENFQIGTYGQD